MGKRQTRWLLLGLLFLGGCENHDAEHLSRLGEKLRQKAEALVAGSNGPLAQAWPGLSLAGSEMPLDVRLSTRLRWDKKLADLNLLVKVEGTTAELTGEVKEADQRRRAVELAESTVGVEKVTDKLEGPE